MLLALLSGQRLQTLHSLSLSSLKVSDSRWVFSVDVPLKQTRKGKHLAPLEFLAFPQNNKLCVVSVLKEYVRRTKDVRGSETKLLLSHQKPHKHVSKDTLARWLRDVLIKAGVDTQQFGAHSTCAASTSAAATCGPWMSYFELQDGARNPCFYKKTPAANMRQALLDSYVHKK